MTTQGTTGDPPDAQPKTKFKAFSSITPITSDVINRQSLKLTPADTWSYAMPMPTSGTTYTINTTTSPSMADNRIACLIGHFANVPTEKLSRAAKFAEVFLKMRDRMDLLVQGGMGELIDERTIEEFVLDVFGIPVTVAFKEPADGKEAQCDSGDQTAW